MSRAKHVRTSDRARHSPDLASDDATTIAGIRITHPERVAFPRLGLTKLDVIRYYDSVAEWMLPHLRSRPLTLVQCAPDADHCRYLRHSGERAPEQVRVVKIQEQTKIGDYMAVDDLRGLIALAQRNIIEFHTWNASLDHLEHPNRVVLDLDPGPEVPWRDMVHAAILVRDTLSDIGLRSWLKTTGGKGLHVVVPIAPTRTWEASLTFARTLAETLVQHDPDRYTVKFAKRGRERLILLDYLRNNRTNTSVAAYSARARELATVSVPLDWDELSVRTRPDRWTVKTVARRLKTQPDPWKHYFKTTQRLPK
jgi:bifunctional non-homologous end joining protein LigD